MERDIKMYRKKEGKIERKRESESNNQMSTYIAIRGVMNEIMTITKNCVNEGKKDVIN